MHGILEKLEKVRPPNISFGDCRNSTRCSQKRVNLGNGYCIICWDKGLGDEDSDWDWYLDQR